MGPGLRFHRSDPFYATVCFARTGCVCFWPRDERVAVGRLAFVDVLALLLLLLLLVAGLSLSRPLCTTTVTYMNNITAIGRRCIMTMCNIPRLCCVMSQWLRLGSAFNDLRMLRMTSDKSTRCAGPTACC
jgi:hypothetical protein